MVVRKRKRFQGKNKNSDGGFIGDLKPVKRTEEERSIYGQFVHGERWWTFRVVLGSVLIVGGVSVGVYLLIDRLRNRDRGSGGGGSGTRSTLTPSPGGGTTRIPGGGGNGNTTSVPDFDGNGGDTSTISAGSGGPDPVALAVAGSIGGVFVLLLIFFLRGRHIVLKTERELFGDSNVIGGTGVVDPIPNDLQTFWSTFRRTPLSTINEGDERDRFYFPLFGNAFSSKTLGKRKRGGSVAGDGDGDGDGNVADKRGRSNPKLVAGDFQRAVAYFRLGIRNDSKALYRQIPGNRLRRRVIFKKEMSDTQYNKLKTSLGKLAAKYESAKTKLEGLRQEREDIKEAWGGKLRRNSPIEKKVWEQTIRVAKASSDIKAKMGQLFDYNDAKERLESIRREMGGIIAEVEPERNWMVRMGMIKGESSSSSPSSFMNSSSTQDQAQAQAQAQTGQSGASIFNLLSGMRGGGRK